MKLVIAFDVSMGKSYIVVYNALKKCIVEKEIQHTRADFEELKQLINDLTAGYDEVPHLVFEATGVYSRALERFIQENSYPYYLLNPLEAKLQSDRLLNHKTVRADAHQLASSHFYNNGLIAKHSPISLFQNSVISSALNPVNQRSSI